jgi:acyl-CoA thioesterase-2
VNKSLASLLEVNRLEQLETHIFKGDAGHDPVGHVYGGLVMAQAVSAAQQTVDECFILHSMHAYFLRAGDNKVPIIYEVNPVRDGKSFISRQLVAKQNGQVIFDCALSFQLEEEGGHHQAAMPTVAPPEQLLSDKDLFEALIPDNSYGWPIEFRQVDPMDFRNPQPKEPRACIWFKAASVLPDDLCIHQQLLAYASDNPILMTALRPHGLIPFSPGLKTATINHSLWLHRPFRVDDWLLYEIDSDFVGGGRGMSRGKIFNRQGELVASAAQEGLARFRHE